MPLRRREEVHQRQCTDSIVGTEGAGKRVKPQLRTTTTTMQHQLNEEKWCQTSIALSSLLENTIQQGNNSNDKGREY